ncbi:hypothetical protein ACIBEA_21520 [Streptomyces sp. NPDC051555]|uniref:CIS tube protein n=1 Tax=Streptomyces sp. NPDC051555 TaxID=3365657 RepID=UPI0037B7A2A0
MEKAILTAYEPPLGGMSKPDLSSKDPLAVDYNPAKLSLVKETEWARHAARLAPHTSVPEFLGGRPRILTMSLLFDEANESSKPVDAKVKKLMKWCEVTTKSHDRNEPSPPWLTFTWGKMSTVNFYMVLKQLSVQYLRFSHDGTPLAARCELVLEEVGV